MSDKQFDIKIGTPGSENIDASKQKVHGLVNALNALTGVMSGQISVANGLMHASRGLYDIIGKGVAWIGIAVAVGKATQALAEYAAKMIYATRITEEGGAATRSFRHALEDLEKVKLESLKKEIEGLGSSMDDLQKQWDRERGREKTVGQAKAEAEIASIQAGMSEGPEKQKALASARAKYEFETFKAEEDAAKDKIMAAGEQKKEAQAKLQELKDAVRNAAPGRDQLVAEEQLKIARPGIEKKISQADQARLDQEATLEALKYRRQASTSNLQGSVSSADAAASSAQNEADRKARIEADKAELEALKGEGTDVQGQLGSVQLAHLRARAAAQRSAAPVGNTKFNPRSFSAPKNTGSQAASEAEKGFSEMEQALMATLQRITQRMEQLTGQIKNGERGS